MDPLTALSVASSIIAFVDYGGKLLSKTRKLYRSAQGVQVSYLDLETISADLINLTQALKRKLPEHRLASDSVAERQEKSEDDEALDRICLRCVEIAEELKIRLERLKIEPREVKAEDDGGVREGISHTEPDTQSTNSTTPRKIRFGSRTRQILGGDGSIRAEWSKGRQFRTWEAFRKTLEASWNKTEIEELAATLRDYRSEIEIRILVSFRGTLNDLSTRQSEANHQISQSTQLILDAFLNGRDSLANQLRVQSEKLIRLEALQSGRTVLDYQKDEDFLRGGLRPSGAFESPKGLSALEKQEGKHDEQDPLKEARVEDEIRLMAVENAILGSLSFTTQSDRLESLDDPHSQTFEWIFQEDSDSVRPWSNFVDWLQHGHGVYWINGKVGSGKSTLMRYIYKNPQTGQALKAWSGSMPSEVSGFFFWNSGDEDQRTQRGLLRSLLLDVLQHHRDLLPNVMPEAWMSWSAQVNATLSGTIPVDSLFMPLRFKSWTMKQLKLAFQRLLNSLRGQVKLCFFVDGLDEYDGEYSEIIDLFFESSTSPDVKFCVSSRPLLVFEQAFSEMPGLKLQDLTYRDISHFVKSRLQSHKHMMQLSKHHPAATTHLINEIVTKSRGVFLWVKLVIKSLLRGLNDCNRISDLEKRIEYLPEDLEALYAHILSHIDPFYREQTSRLFQIFRAAQKHSQDKITLLNLSWADDEDELLAETAPIRPLSNEEIVMRCQVMDSRLKSVCAGLLESNEVRFSSIAPDSRVMFLHRTVSDWLGKEQVWNQLTSVTAGTGFSANLAMLKSRVLNLKALDPSPRVPLEMSTVCDALEYARYAEMDLNNGFPKLLDQLDVTVSLHWRIRGGNAIPSTSYVMEADPSKTVPNLGGSISTLGRTSKRPSIKGHAMVNGPGGCGNLGNEALLFTSQTQRWEGDEDPHYLQSVVEWESEVEEDDDHFFDALSHAIPNKGGSEGALHHWSYSIEVHGLKPAGKPSTFYDVAGMMDLSHYVRIKYDSGRVVDQDVEHHLLLQAIGIQIPDPILVMRVLENGADPNFSYDGNSPWHLAMIEAVSCFVSQDHRTDTEASTSNAEWQEKARSWAQVLELFVQHGADPNARTTRHPMLAKHPRLSPRMIAESYYPEFLKGEAAELIQLLEHKGARDAREVREDLPSVGGEEQTMVQEISNESVKPKKMSIWILSWLFQ
ncbi:hypothetical protein BX600DRAFT_443733 [Xylariales sp. PMI_506]|nr:hypothetical protein BX600DRAFT_443733 [Xylariales sp. PMI_506]